MPMFYLSCLLLLNVISTPWAISQMPDECPEESRNCAHVVIELDVSDEELNDAIREWARDRSFTTTYSEGHVIDRTLLMQFPDDLLYENRCGTVELHSQSRLGIGDLGVNNNRLENLIEFLENFDWKSTCQ